MPPLPGELDLNISEKAPDLQFGKNLAKTFRVIALTDIPDPE